MDENIIKNDSNNKICENSTNSVNENATNIMNSETSYTSQGVYESVNSSNPVFYTAKEGEVQPEYEMNTKQKKAKKQKKEKIKKPVTMGKVFATCVAFLIITVLVNTAVIYCLFEYTDLGINIAEDKRNGSNIKIGTTAEVINGSSSSGTSGGATGENTLGDEESNITNTSSQVNEKTYTVAEIGQMVMPSIVAITNTAIVTQNYNPFYGGGSYQVTGAGSGIIIKQTDTELLIITNNHVIEDSTSLTVEFVNGTSTDDAYVKATSPTNDLAIVAIPLESIDGETADAIKIAVLGNSDELVVGDQVVAIGNALGYGQSLTVGYVSAVNREITVDSKKLTVIQTDAAINGGNSGGALINMKGEVIGINSAKSSTSSTSSSSVEGMGYAIPVSHAGDIIDTLLEQANKTKYDDDSRGYLGANTITVDSTTSSQYGFPTGAYIRDVIDGSPADEAGLIAGSVIVSVEGVDVSSASELIDQLSYYTEGDTITITAYVPSGRKYTQVDYEITLGSKDIFDN